MRGATRRCQRASLQILFHFNPRTPCGVRLELHNAAHRLRSAISIHAPRAGCDIIRRTTLGFSRLISIHAPRAGCDQQTRMCFSRLSPYFNPRTPCGVRPGARRFSSCWTNHFNPRTPCGVRQLAVRAVALSRDQFQSTHPVRGATYKRRDQRPKLSHFNPRTTCGVRRQTCTTWFAPIFATLPNQMYVCLHYTCFTTLFQPKTWFSAVFQRCEAPRESMSAPASHRVKASAAPPAHRSAWRRYAQRGSDSYSQDCKSAGCPSPG